MWDERYSTKEYVYGTEPSEFLKENVEYLPRGKVLSLAEGEGRNAVFLAKLGYEVTAVDASLVGIEKGKVLADDNNVVVDFVHADLADFDIGVNQWEGIVSIFCPLPSKLRGIIHNSVVSGLKYNGVFLLQAYTPKQLNYRTGGGASTDVMQTKLSLSKELNGLEFTRLNELERNVVEGIYHTGLASVVETIAVKKGYK